VPCGESSMWGDTTHAELALMLLREATNQAILQVFQESLNHFPIHHRTSSASRR